MRFSVSYLKPGLFKNLNWVHTHPDARIYAHTHIHTLQAVEIPDAISKGGVTDESLDPPSTRV